MRTTPAALARQDRDRRALRLRASGLAYAQIAGECEYTNAHHALVSVQRLLRRQTRAAVEEAKGIHRERLETLLRSLWLPAVNPGMAQQVARQAGHPLPPSQERAIELLIRLLDQLAKVEGTYAPTRAEVSGTDDGPIEGRIDVMHWTPDDAFLARYARVLKEAGLLDEDEVEDPAPLGSDEGDPEVEPE